MNYRNMSNVLFRLVAVGALALGASACSTMPDWVDPTTWIGGSSDTASTDTNTDTASNGDTANGDVAAPPADATAQASADTAGNGDTASNADNNAQFPDLADVPDRPTAPSTSDDRKQVANALVADRQQAQYSAEALRGGTEAAAPPPGAESDTPDTSEADTAANSADDDNTAANDSGSAASSASSADAASAPTDNAAPTTKVATAEAPPPVSGGGDGLPAVPRNAVSTFRGVASNPTVSDAALGFQRSSAPPLDSAVSQFVAQPIIDRYRQTSQMVAAPGISANAATATRVALNVPAGARPFKAAASDSEAAVGGPERMSGAVVADFDALQSASTVPAAVYASAQGMPPAAVVFFPHDTTVLTAEAKAQVREAVQAFNERGGSGFIRVVGHSSSRTGNMPLSRHLEYNFERSQARASAVARELIREGIPAAKVLVEAVGDSQPVYYESMPQGEEGNRRAEIFFQS